MVIHRSLITRKGKVTIPAEIRHALDPKEGDTVVWSIENDHVRLTKSPSVVERTAGILCGEGATLTAEEERAAMEQAVAEEVVQRTKR